MRLGEAVTTSIRRVPGKLWVARFFVAMVPRLVGSSGDVEYVWYGDWGPCWQGVFLHLNFAIVLIFFGKIVFFVFKHSILVL